jgi:hypothetical protein
MPRKAKKPAKVARPEEYAVLPDPVTGKNRPTILLERLSRMMPVSLDKLPGPCEFRGWVGKGKKRKLVRLEKAWVGFAWTDGGEATGQEPLLCLDETCMTADEFEVARVHAS